MPFVKPLGPLSPELQALMSEAHEALKNAEVGKLAPFPPGLMDRIEGALHDEYVARRRLEWLHSSGSYDVDGWEWGIFRVRWLNNGAGNVAEVQQTLANFSDLDAAITSSQSTGCTYPNCLCPADNGKPLCQQGSDAGRLAWVAQAWGGQRDDFASHTLTRGGNGDLSDIRTFVDAAAAASAGSPGVTVTPKENSHE
jgi:hypothetical protein